jgi:hypothetical protein
VEQCIAATLNFDCENRMLNKSGRRKTGAAGMERKLSWRQHCTTDASTGPYNGWSSEEGLSATVCTALIQTYIQRDETYLAIDRGGGMGCLEDRTGEEASVLRSMIV